MAKSSKSEALKKKLVNNIGSCKECGSKKHSTKEHEDKVENKKEINGDDE